MAIRAKFYFFMKKISVSIYTIIVYVLDCKDPYERYAFTWRQTIIISFHHEKVVHAI